MYICAILREVDLDVAADLIWKVLEICSVEICGKAVWEIVEFKRGWTFLIN